MLDVFIYGDVKRISPEAPVPVVSVKENNFLPGGAANVAYNIKQLGVNTELFGVVGRDYEGDKLISSLKEKNINTTGIIRLIDRPTTTKTRILAENQQIVRCDKETTGAISKKTSEAIISRMEKSIKKRKPDAVIISDYNKGTISKDIISRILKINKNSRAIIFADPKGNDAMKYKGVDVITPNAKELSDLTATDITANKSLNRAVNDLMDRCKLAAIVVTRGKHGISFKSKNGQLINIASQAKDVYDVTGAGDTVISSLVVAYLLTRDLRTSVEIANASAGLVINRIGTSSISQSEFIEFLESDNTKPKKHLELAHLKSEILKHRQNNKSIVFTNGCFDILHPGHLKLLNKAKSLGDILVVGLNSDSSVKKLKGKSRPLINQVQRSSIISLLDAVDYVTIFGEDTPLHLIKEIMPDIIVKGGDYSADKVVGKEFVENYGGKVIIVPLFKNYSTSAIVSGMGK